MTFLTEPEKAILKLIWKHKRFQVAKAILTEKEQYYRILIAMLSECLT
jgi:hypothetical protein